METFNLAFAVLGLAGEVIVRAVFQFEPRFDQIEHRDKLRENEHLVTFLVELVQQIEQGFHLGGLLFEVFGIDQARVAADLAQAHESLEDGEGVFLHLLIGIEAQQGLLDAFEFGLVEVELDAFHFRVHLFFGAGRQVLGDLEFGAPDKERPQARGQPALAERILALVEALFEVGARAEHPGHRERHQRPHIKQAVLDGRAGKDQAVLGIEFAGALGGFGVRVLDLLALVQNHGEPFDAVEFLATDTELRVVEDQNVDVVLDVVDIDVDPVLEDLEPEIGGELLGLAGPHIEHRLRADDERRFLGAVGFQVFVEEPQQVGEGLDGFAEAHVVGEDAAEIVDR